MAGVLVVAAPPRADDRRADVLAGARAMVPLLAGVAPLGVAVGTTAASSEAFGPLAGWSTSWALFSGTPQLVALRMADRGASAAAIVLTVVVVNLRLTVYAAALAPAWRTASARYRALAAYLLTDPCFVVASRDVAAGLPDDSRHRRYLGAALTLWVGWLGACGLGVLAGEHLGDAVPADLVLELILLSMVLRLSGTGRQHARVAALAMVLAVPAAGLPLGLGTLGAAAVATAVGCRADLTARSEGAGS